MGPKEIKQQQHHDYLDKLMSGERKLIPVSSDSIIEKGTREDIIKHYKRVVQNYNTVIETFQAGVTELQIKNRVLEAKNSELLNKDYTNSGEAKDDQIDELKDHINWLTKEVKEFADGLEYET